ncbi:hypothetical protein [Streptomyces nojiriensis]|uniref:hypothetical protein n=1 Tax=Streptomyces nojiriensis TaxID=66374 RepID=UPI00365DFD68
MAGESWKSNREWSSGILSPRSSTWVESCTPLPPGSSPDATTTTVASGPTPISAGPISYRRTGTPATDSAAASVTRGGSMRDIRSPYPAGTQGQSGLLRL